MHSGPQAKRGFSKQHLMVSVLVLVAICCTASGAASATPKHAPAWGQAPYGFSADGVGHVSEPQSLMSLDRSSPQRWLQTDTPAAAAADDFSGLSLERAQLLLRSLTVPGWGQAQRGSFLSAGLFALAEVGVWTAFATYTRQGHLRTESYERSALHLAGIDLDGRDEEFRRIVGSYISSEEYNQLVVFRDAANLFYDNPEQMRAYIEANSLGGVDTWAWGSDEELLRYRGQRKNAQRAERRANTTLALAVVNRLLSALHAARTGGSSNPNAQRSWKFEVAPAGGDDPSGFRLGVRAGF